MAKKIPEINGPSVVSPIASDTELEKTINLGNYEYYIILSGEGSGTSGVKTRVAPYEDDLELGWSDTNYELENLNNIKYQNQLNLIIEEIKEISLK